MLVSMEKAVIATSRTQVSDPADATGTFTALKVLGMLLLGFNPSQVAVPGMPNQRRTCHPAMRAKLPPSIAEPFREFTKRALPYSVKRGLLLRTRVLLQRADIESYNREAAALEARLRNMKLAPNEKAAETARLKQLRREAAIGEANVLQLKKRASIKEREGWSGAAVRTAEVLAGSQYRPLRLFFTEMTRTPDPLVALRDDTASLLRLATNLTLVEGYIGLRQAPRLIPHAAAIYSKLARLERFAPGILGVLSSSSASEGEEVSYLELIEPHLDTILERFDDIEPHLPWVLDNIDILVPHCGTLLKHLDGLLLYAADDDNEDTNEEDGVSYTRATSLLDYVPIFAPQFDALAPHLPLIRPHLMKVIPILPAIAPHAKRFAPHVGISANADVLLWYFGWVLRVPVLRRVILAPGMPRLANFFARRLPRFPVRGLSRGPQCDWEECDVSYVANAKRYYELIGSEADVQPSVRAALGNRKAARAWKRWRRDNRSGEARGGPLKRWRRKKGDEAIANELAKSQDVDL